jgi:tRNA_anti-like
MRQRIVATIGAIVSLGLFFLTYAKRLADFFAVVHLPADIGEALTKMSNVPTLVSWGGFAIGMFCAGYLVFDYFGRKREPKEAVPALQVDRVVEAGETPTAKPEATAKPERVFVPPELTPERLFSFYQDNTAIHAAERVKPHIGQWIKITGMLGDVRPWTGIFSQVTFERSSTPVLERTWLDYTTIYMYFRDAQKIDRLKILKRGDKMTVIGQLHEVDAVDLRLDNCELAD